ncbi:MAG: hypothetical protein MSH11_04070 [Ruminococcus sp.]|nr:hypothetical protein [Ruminococcus sp.]
MKIKRIIALLLITVTPLIAVTGCSEEKEPEQIIKGYKDSQVYSDNNENDKENFSKYIYEKGAEKKFAKSQDYEKVTAENKEDISGIFEDFQKWASISTFQDEYDIKPDIVTEGDYFCIVDSDLNNDNIGQRKSRTVYRQYTLYLYDTESHTLYYINHDIT